MADKLINPTPHPDRAGGFFMEEKMKNVIQIFVETKPVPKGRPRINKKTGVVYTPRATKKFEEAVALKAKMVMTKPLEGPLALTVHFYFKGEEKHHTKRPDIDNLLKSTLDGLNGISFKDDSQIVELTAKKCNGSKDFVNIFIEDVTKRVPLD